MDRRARRTTRSARESESRCAFRSDRATGRNRDPDRSVGARSGARNADPGMAPTRSPRACRGTPIGAPGPSPPARAARSPPLARCRLRPPRNGGDRGCSPLPLGPPPGHSGWRRERDSNPRGVAPYTLSRRAPSTTRPSLRGARSSRPPCQRQAGGRGRWLHPGHRRARPRDQAKMSWTMLSYQASASARVWARSSSLSPTLLTKLSKASSFASVGR